MYSTASLTRVIFSASSSGISMPNSSSNAITSSTVSSESAPRSSTNDASGVTSSSSTPSCSTMMLFTLSATAIRILHGLHVHPAVDGEYLSCNIRCLVRCKETYGGGDVVGRAQALERNLRRPVRLCIAGDRPRHIRLDQARRHYVDGDAARGDFLRRGFHEADQPRLRRRVVRLSGVAGLPDHGADAHDAA